jgi:glycosyltransferase involved in cell wall biosynthesis
MVSGPAANLPLISIITPSYNQGAFIEQTIRSVLLQDYPRVQHIVVDGGSTDGTLEVLRHYPHLEWLSEPDRGQADALNKGLRLAKGDIIGWINSDDYYVPAVFASVARHFETRDADWLVGNLANVFGDGESPKFLASPKIDPDTLMRNPDIVRQQPTFFRRSAIEAAGGWNAQFYMAMDFDLWMRLARVSAPAMVDENWALFRCHAAQKSGHANMLRQSREIAAIMRREGVPPRFVAGHIVLKRWYWLKGVVKSWLLSAGLLPARYHSRPLRG